MAKRRQPKTPKNHSPLTAAGGGSTPGNGGKKKAGRPKSQKRARKEAQEDLEEQHLTNLIFGGTATNHTGVHDDDDDDDALQTGPKTAQVDEEQFTFQIDRTGLPSADEIETENSPVVEDSDGGHRERRNDDDDDADADSSASGAQADAPAWEDPDDVEITLLESSNRLKKLRKSREETKALSGPELEQRLRDRYEQSTKATARTDWASAVVREYKDEDEAAENLFSTSSSLLASSTNRLPPNILTVVRCPDANQSDPNHAVVQAVHFHPASDPDQPLMLTAGLDKTLRFFQVGEEKSQKIHGIHFPKLPIYNASFLGSTGNVVVSGRRSFFYIYDAVAGKVDLVPRIMGREEKSWEKHAVSPDGRLIAFMGNDGYIVLVDAHTKHWIGDLKLNGSVRAIAFSPDGKYIVASGSDGDIYRWDIHSRRCIERFSNNDGTITSSLAVSAKTLAVGAESGVVNLYSEYASRESKSPLKSIMNLRTSADQVRFNHDGQILAMSTRRERDGLKLLHVPSKTVFSNWPTNKTPLKYVWSMDFSPQSRFLAIGNDKGKCILYKLNHYSQR
mmetsp:Transcript_115793/g.173044  ORF Transcript_115793/g.173044 Transcript_115793/m.173044 type:complete len:563 (-) Transcript_115793:26-1714(-)|eukprot:CAMPEP_0117020148 /NCGR_PEP_ID=MMETSP0472-20121206/15352_1 /TAXON_ID=693140 ORGANISM="Tiarina fusus, Strain LIS" /NCGR_SAMPLE_ID=MMETSP0472 /ASSEMBLY_ACC=CAM_ASM_000603 /LENGTH=562 /DNA_ID=CAMNT_0004725275 /DNA_START=312 /DNA_END=2000 /DNA_ORIENTATION=-